MKGISLLLMLLSALACRTAQDIVSPGAGLIGSWQYVERGYSPGAGYIVDQIPRKPVQRVDFLPENTVRTSNIDDQLFSSASTYRIDSTQFGPRISLFDSVKKPVGPAMTISFEDDKLKIMPPCFEGCHYGFVRIRD
jgi:hypothetical protein